MITPPLRIRAMQIFHRAPARLARWLREETGSTLVMGTGVIATLSISLGGTLTIAAESGRHANHSNAQQQAFALAEAGLNDAVAVLNAGYALGTVQYPGDASLLPERTTVYANGSARWSGTLQKVSGRPWAYQWTLNSRSSVTNPTGPGAAPVTSSVSAVVPVVMPSGTTIQPASVLNWVFAGTDLAFSSSVEIGSPAYATRDFTLGNSAKVQGIAQKIGVGRNLTLINPQNKIGLLGGTDPRIGQVHVAGQCSSKATPALHACNWEADKIFATVADTTIPAGFITLPTLTCCAPVAGAIAPTSGTSTSSMGFWYENASPGPNVPCDPATKTGTPPTFDTGDNTINNSATPVTAFNLTPSTASYTCKTLSGSTVIGELSWNKDSKVLTIQGTVFIDGSAAIDRTGYTGTPVFTYTGQGTIYLSGTFAIKSAIMCAVGDNNQCNTTAGAWDPNQKALIVVADGDGAYGGAQSQGNVVGSGNGIEVVSSHFQGALIANKTIKIDTSSKDQGPLISVYNKIDSGQTGILSFPTIGFAPAGGAGVSQPIPAGKLLAAIEFSG